VALMRLKLIDTIEDGAVWPRWMGFAYWRHEERRAVVAIMPLHLVIAVCRRAFFAFRRGLYPSKHEQEVAAAYERGRRDGSLEALKDSNREMAARLSGGSA
jgi:hypothetical protein